jgi:hypothetical protein
MKFLFLSLFGLFLGSCGGTNAEIVFEFPDNESFLITNYMKVEAFEYKEGDEEACEKLLKGLPIINNTVFRKATLDPCSLKNGLELSDYDSQKLIFFIEGMNKWDLSIVAGCQPATLSESKTALEIKMQLTDNYPTDVTTICETVENKCDLNMDCDY